MAITFVVSASNNGNSASPSVTTPAGIQSGDVIIASIHGNGSTPSITDNNGSNPFTDSGLGLREVNNTSASTRIMYRVAGSSEPASYAWTLGESNRWTVIISVYRGVDTSTIFDVAPSAALENKAIGVSPASVATTDITTLTDGAEIIAIGLLDSASVTFTATPGDSFNSRENKSGQQLAALADKLKTTAGLQSSVSWTQSSNVGWNAYIFSLKQAAAASTGTHIFGDEGLIA